jgi:hypothetical protein
MPRQAAKLKYTNLYGNITFRVTETATYLLSS